MPTSSWQTARPDEVPDEVIAEGPATADEEAAGAGGRSDLTGAGTGGGA